MAGEEKGKECGEGNLSGVGRSQDSLPGSRRGRAGSGGGEGAGVCGVSACKLPGGGGVERGPRGQRGPCPECGRGRQGRGSPGWGRAPQITVFGQEGRQAGQWGSVWRELGRLQVGLRGIMSPSVCEAQRFLSLPVQPRGRVFHLKGSLGIWGPTPGRNKGKGRFKAPCLLLPLPPWEGTSPSQGGRGWGKRGTTIQIQLGGNFPKLLGMLGRVPPGEECKSLGMGSGGVGSEGTPPNPNNWGVSRGKGQEGGQAVPVLSRHPGKSLEKAGGGGGGRGWGCLSHPTVWGRGRGLPPPCLSGKEFTGQGVNQAGVSVHLLGQTMSVPAPSFPLARLGIR